MAKFAEYCCWAGFSIWLVTILLAPDLFAGPLVTRPRDLLIRRFRPATLAESADRTSLSYDTLLVINWFAWAYFALQTTGAIFGETDTKFATATIGYVYIMLCMPISMAGWLWLVHVGSHRTVPMKLLAVAPIGGALVLTAYSTIG